MTSREKKEYIALGLISIVIVWVLFTHFSGSNSDQAGQTAVGGTPAAGKLLPNGPDIDLNILQDPRFRSLVAPVYPRVNRSEVGSTDPFK